MWSWPQQQDAVREFIGSSIEIVGGRVRHPRHLMKVGGSTRFFGRNAAGRGDALDDLGRAEHARAAVRLGGQQQPWNG